MVQLIALEVNLCAAQMLGHALGEIQRAGPTDIMLRIIVDFRLKAWIRLGIFISLLDLKYQRHQGLSDEPPAIKTKTPAFIRTGAIGI